MSAAIGADLAGEFTHFTIDYEALAAANRADPPLQCLRSRPRVGEVVDSSSELLGITSQAFDELDELLPSMQTAARPVSTPDPADSPRAHQWNREAA
jgi:hypothetical protein